MNVSQAGNLLGIWVLKEADCRVMTPTTYGDSRRKKPAIDLRSNSPIFFESSLQISEPKRLNIDKPIAPELFPPQGAVCCSNMSAYSRHQMWRLGVYAVSERLILFGPLHGCICVPSKKNSTLAVMRFMS